ncbi:unnamed protein product [Pylaiella littoralis]
MENLYEVLQTLGRGSFGVVRKVRRREDGKTLVVKEMDYGAADEKQKEQIVAEVNILRELRHPFIVRYYDRIVDRRRTRLHIVMEHCSTDLARVIKTRRLRGEYLEETFLWNLMCQVVVALEVCHGRVGKGGARRPIIHRDLKPENVFLTSENVVKLGDFGLAKELSGAQLAETSVGTPYYMSPELINEQRYDERTDVWSLGCLMYEASALTRPFNAHNQLALAMKINTGKVAPIPSRYSPGLFATIEWMLNKTRHKRPRMEDLIKVPGLQLPLRENRLLVQEFQLQQSYVRRLRTLKSRENEIERREAELAVQEARLLRRSEQSLADPTRSPREQCGWGKRLGSGGGAASADCCCRCSPTSSFSERAATAVAVGAAGEREWRRQSPRPLAPTTRVSRLRQHEHHQHQQAEEQEEEEEEDKQRRRRRQQRQQQRRLRRGAAASPPACVPLPGGRKSLSSAISSSSSSSGSGGSAGEAEERGVGLAMIEGDASGVRMPPPPPRRTWEGRGGQGEDGQEDVTLVHQRRPVGDADPARRGGGVGSGGVGDRERTAVGSGPEDCRASAPTSDKSELAQDVTRATAAVLDYASFVLHSSPRRHESPVRRSRSSSSDSGGSDGRGMIEGKGGKHRHPVFRGGSVSGGGDNSKNSDDGGGGGDCIENMAARVAAAGTTTSTTTPGVSPLRSSSCLDDTVPMDSHDPAIVPVRPAPRTQQQQQQQYRYRYRGDDDASSFPDAGGGGGGVGVAVDKVGRRRARGGWKDGAESHSIKTEAVMAAGRRARESYAGFMETIAAARNLGTRVAPVRPPHENEENLHGAADTATAFRGTTTPHPCPSPNTPLVELPNGRGGREHRNSRCPPTATLRSASTAAAAAWQDYKYRNGGAKEIRVGGGSSGRRVSHDDRSASDATSAARGVGYLATPSPRGPRAGVGGNGRRRAAAAAASAVSDDVHLAAVAMARARRGRLSSRC